MELFGWMQRHPERRARPRARLARPRAAAPLLDRRALARHQLEVAEAALAACLELEDDSEPALARPSAADEAAMGVLASFASTTQNFALTWLPVMFFL